MHRSAIELRASRRRRRRRRRTANICSPNSCGTVLARSLSPSVCLTPPEKVRKTAAGRPPPPRFFLSIDDMSNKTESERDIETRGGIDVINEPASHSIRSIDRETRILK